MRNLILSLMVVMTIVSCTENSRAKTFGGTMTINVPVGNKVTNITWKGSQLWYSYRELQEGEVPVIQHFVEDSKWGMVEGEVIFFETK